MLKQNSCFVPADLLSSLKAAVATLPFVLTVGSDSLIDTGLSCREQNPALRVWQSYVESFCR